MRGHPTNSDFDSTTVYDGMGRRVQTTWQPMNSGVDNGSAVTLNYYYDPQVEFLELGLNDNGDHTWKVYGPDRSGSYGGAQGEGGLENEIDEAGGFANVPINNYFGDALGESYVPTIVSSSYYYTYGYGSALGGYGYEPGSVVYSLTPQWRGHYVDWTGFIYKGARYYDFQSGRFLSADPLGNGASMSLYDYANGDPVNGLDPDGRFGKSVVTNIENDATLDYESAVVIFSSQTTWGEKAEAGLVMVAASTDLALNFTGVEGLADDVLRNGIEDVARSGVEDVVDSGAQNIFDAGGQDVAQTGGQNLAESGGEDVAPDLFRGTTDGYPGSATHQALGITPTSLDPATATIFATESATATGELGVVHIASSEGLPLAEENALAAQESAVNIALTPSEFAAQADTTITVTQARAILQSMGISTPARVYGFDGITAALQNTPKLTPAQIQQFANAARGL